jgi:hypothetical protein
MRTKLLHDQEPEGPLHNVLQEPHGLVYSRSIKARVSYASARKGQEARYIDPYDSIQVFHTPAMRRIHLGICESDPSDRVRCGGLCQASIGDLRDRWLMQVEERAEMLVHRFGPVHRCGLRWVTSDPAHFSAGFHLSLFAGVDVLSHAKKAAFWRDLVELFPNMIDYLCNPNIDPVS